MKSRELEWGIGVALSICLYASPVAAAGSVSIRIDAGTPGPRLNPRMYGIFLEEINHGVDGGLYAELIRNRGLEDAKPPEGFRLINGRWLDRENGHDAGFHYPTDGLPWWSLIREGEAKGSMHLDLQRPLNPVNPRSLRLEVEDASGRIGVANEGFWGIAAKKGEQYRLSFWARCAGGFRGPLTVALEDAAGNACTEPVNVDGLEESWKQFHATLKGIKNEPNARFVITAASKGAVWLEMVSLFPAKTYEDRPNGLRPDVAQMLADLKPGFVRFPGGCVVEGGTIETAYDWKKTVGPPEQREETWNVWNYRRTHGMGFHEYLQFCEDISAEPLFVAFAGQTCAFRHWEHVPLDQMKWVVDNYLDAVEYANGPVDSEWGKRRSAAGRPEPFGLKMLEIGNENVGQGYEERYPLIYKAIKARYPDMPTIACFLQRQAPTEMVDDHFYNSPRWFMENVHLYDSRDRKLPPVYVGEIAVTSEEGGPDKGNLVAALAECAFLMGLERNADVVRMVSYAPLLAHVNGRSGWHGMIYFDSQRTCGTVSYHLWKLFGLNRPDLTLQTVVETEARKEPAITGAIGVGTWDTSADFKEIRVEKDGKLLYASDFLKGDEGWSTDGGKWLISNGAYRQEENVVGLAYSGDENWSDYTLTLKARKLSGAEGFLVVFGHKGGDKYWWNIGGWGNREHAIEWNRTPVGRRVPGSVETNRWYDIKVQLQDRRICCYLDGNLIHDVTVRGVERFFALAGRDEATGDLIIKVINTASEPMKTRLNITGVESLKPEANVTVLKSGDLRDNNSLDEPNKVLPKTATIQGVAAEFTHEFPAYSCTVMRLKTR